MILVIGIPFILISVLAFFILHHSIIGDRADLLLLYNTYNSLYLFGIKGCLETWNCRKNKNFFLAILLTLPLLVVLGLTLFVGFFFVVNCF
jgi:hypothetical protein